MILLLAGIANYFGLRVSGRLSLVLSGSLLALLLITVILSLPRVEWSRFAPFFPHGWLPVGTAATMVFWSFFGWEAICNLSERFQRPEKDIVRSTLISAVIIGILFLSLSLVTVGTGTYGNPESDLSPVGVMMENSLGVGARIATALLAFVICLGTVNAFVASLGQLGYALSRDGAFPKWFCRLHPVTKAPTRVVAVVICFACCGVAGLSVFSISFHDILNLPNSLGVTVYVLSMAAGVRLFPKTSLARAASFISLILCGLCLPFFGVYLLTPIAVAGMYALYAGGVGRAKSVGRRHVASDDRV